MKGGTMQKANGCPVRSKSAKPITRKSDLESYVLES